MKFVHYNFQEPVKRIVAGLVPVSWSMIIDYLNVTWRDGDELRRLAGHLRVKVSRKRGSGRRVKLT